MTVSEEHLDFLGKKGIIFLETLGHGATAEVFRAIDTIHKKTIAIKAVFIPPDRENYLARIEREFDLVAGLEHPGVIKTFDLFKGDRFCYLMMEFIHGETLESFAEDVPFTRDSARVYFHILKKIALSLDYIHRKGVLHRDLKPSNIMLGGIDTNDSHTFRGLDNTGKSFHSGLCIPEQVKIGDFGLARPVEKGLTLTTTGTVPGTAAYMPPELARGASFDSLSDLYSLGIIMYRVLTGRVPYEGDHPVSVILKHLGENPVPPSRINADVPCSLEEITLRLMEKTPHLRFVSGAAVADAISAAEKTFVTDTKRKQTNGYGSSFRLSDEMVLPVLHFAGRRQESSRFERLLGKALHGSGGSILVYGIEGVGKSRLLREWKNRARELGFETMRTVVRHGDMVPMRPFLGIAVGMLNRHSSEKETESLRSIGLEALMDRNGGYTRFFEKMGSWSEFKASFFAAFLSTMEALADKIPSIFFIEHIDLADSSSLDLLLYITQKIGSSGILLCCSAQDGVFMDRVLMKRLKLEKNFTEMRLNPLDRTDVSIIVEETLGKPDVPDDFYTVMLELSKGNPGNLRDIIDGMIMEGNLVLVGGRWRFTGSLPEFAEDITVKIIDDVIKDKIEKLNAEEREILEICSLVERGLDKKYLEAVTGLSSGRLNSILGKLANYHFVERLPVPGKEIVIFSHNIARRIILETIGRFKKERLHGNIEDALERLTVKEQVSVPLELIAEQLRKSRKKLRAVPYLVKSAERALSVFAEAKAVEFYSLAIEILENEGGEGVEKRIAELKMERGKVLEKRVDYSAAAADFRWVRRTASLIGLQRMKSSAMLREGLVLQKTGSFSDSIRMFEEVVKFGKSNSLPLFIGSAMNNKGLSLWRMGDNEGALSCFEEAIGIWKTAGDEHRLSVTYNNFGLIYFDMGMLDAATDSFNKALVLKEKLGLVHGKALVLNNLGRIAHLRGNIAEAEKLYSHSLSLMLEAGNRAMEAAGYHNMGELINDRGAYPEAIEQFGKARELAHLLGDTIIETETLRSSGAAWREMGEYIKSLELLERARFIAVDISGKEFEAYTLMELGFLHAAVSAVHRAEVYFDEAAKIVKDSGLRRLSSKLMLLECAINLARKEPEKGVNAAEKGIKRAVETSAFLEKVNAEAQLAFALYVAGKSEKALETAESALVLSWNGGRIPALFVKGMTASEKGLYDDAFKAFSEILKGWSAEFIWMAASAVKKLLEEGIEWNPRRGLAIELPSSGELEKRAREGFRNLAEQVREIGDLKSYVSYPLRVKFLGNLDGNVRDRGDSFLRDIIDGQSSD